MPMEKFKRMIMYMALSAIFLLIVFSIYSAFFGPQYAKTFFNSIPLVIYWLFALCLLAGGIIIFKRLTGPSQFLTHAGCIVILAGALYSSQTAQNIFNPQRLYSGKIVIHQ